MFLIKAEFIIMAFLCYKKEALELYIEYLISLAEYATATGFSAIIDGQINHDTVTRFLSEKSGGV
jgi:hypothetical protein